MTRIDVITTGPGGAMTDAGPGEATRATDDADIAETLGLLAVLADPHRRQILLRLADAAVCTCTDLVAATGVGQPTVSHHLKVLREAGLVRGERCGRFVEYTAVPERLRDLAAAFDALADLAAAPADAGTPPPDPRTEASLRSADASVSP